MLVQNEFKSYHRFYIDLINRENYYEITLLKVERVERNFWNNYMIATIQVLKGTCKYDCKVITETKEVKLDISRCFYSNYGVVEFVCINKVRHYATDHRLASFNSADLPNGISDNEYWERLRKKRERDREQKFSTHFRGADFFSTIAKYRSEIDKARFKYFKGEITEEELNRQKSIYQGLIDSLYKGNRFQ